MTRFVHKASSGILLLVLTMCPIFSRAMARARPDHEFAKSDRIFLSFARGSAATESEGAVEVAVTGIAIDGREGTPSLGRNSDALAGNERPSS